MEGIYILLIFVLAATLIFALFYLFKGKGDFSILKNSGEKRENSFKDSGTEPLIGVNETAMLISDQSQNKQREKTEIKNIERIIYVHTDKDIPWIIN